MNLDPLEGKIVPELFDETATPHYRIRQCFIAKPSKEWSVADMVNETHHNPVTVKIAIDQLRGAGIVVYGQPRRSNRGRPSVTHKLNPSFKTEFQEKLEAIEPEPIEVEDADAPDYEEHTCGSFTAAAKPPTPVTDLNAYKAAVEAKKKGES